MSTQSTSTNIPQQLTLASSTPMQTLDLDFIHSFERMVMRFYEHQAEVLRVQEEYLKNHPQFQNVQLKHDPKKLLDGLNSKK